MSIITFPSLRLCLTNHANQNFFFFPETEDTKVLIYHYILLVCMVEQTTNNFIESYIFFPITFSLLWVRIFYRARKKKRWMRKLFFLYFNLSFVIFSVSYSKEHQRIELICDMKSYSP